MPWAVSRAGVGGLAAAVLACWCGSAVEGSAAAVILPTSMLAHTVHTWSVANLFQRAAFLAEECHEIGRAEELCLRALRLSEERADQLPTQDSADAHANAMFRFARFQHKFRGDLHAAEDLYQRVLDLQPHHVGALCNYGLLLHTEPNRCWEAAEDMYERALAIDQRHCATLCNYAALQAQRNDGKGHADHSSMLYDEVLDLAPPASRSKVTAMREQIDFDAIVGG